MKKYSNREIRIRNHIVPSIFIGITISATILILSLLHIYIIHVSKFIVFSSFASSSFLLFMEPKQDSSRISKFVKSYVIAGLVGILGFFVSAYIGIYYTIALVETIIAILLVTFSAMHPPAMGIAVVFVLEEVNFYGILFLFSGMVIIIFFDKFLYKFVYVLEDGVKKGIKEIKT
jgi:hypothetical protein